MLFAGIEGDRVRLIYREYALSLTNRGVNSYAKPIYFLDLNHDLKDTNTIVFRDWELLVLGMEAGKIRYKVTKGPPTDTFDLRY